MMLKIHVLIISVFLFSCVNKAKQVSTEITTLEPNEISCSETGCTGTYIGPEFQKGSDIAHQFSNKMAGRVGDQLKVLYKEEKFSIVDFKNIEMSTKGMGSGSVTYKITIPFKKVKHKCDAFTSFDHVGGWNHTPALEKRKNELKGLLLPGEELDISTLKKTPEGLEEYWIQWKNKEVQKECS